MAPFLFVQSIYSLIRAKKVTFKTGQVFYYFL
jgi:hypothetical protein